MSISVKDAGVWKTVLTPYVKDAGIWKPALEVWVKDAGIWKQAYAASGGGATFTPVPGSYSDEASDIISFTVTASAPVTWTYTLDIGNCDIATGTTASSITYTVAAGASDRTGTLDLTATSGGVTSNWTIVLTALGSGTL